MNGEFSAMLGRPAACLNSLLLHGDERGPRLPEGKGFHDSSRNFLFGFNAGLLTGAEGFGFNSITRDFPLAETTVILED